MELKSFKAVLCGISLLLFSLPSLSDAVKNKVVAILYPSTSSETGVIYNQIIKGISTNTDKFFKKKIKITSDNHNEIKQWILDAPPFSIITIGNDAYELARSTTSKIFIFMVGTLITNTNNDKPGVSLSLREDSLKEKIRFYLPSIQKIHILDEGKNTIYFSNSLYRPHFKLKKIIDINESVKYLWKLINTVDPKIEAVWVNNSIDPEYLHRLAERAWERDVILLSHNPAHLERGVALVFYPDFKSMGERVGQLLKRLQNTRKLGSLEPLEAINLGINMRTARHLGVSPLIPKEKFKIILK